MSDDRPDWCKGQVQLKYEGQMVEDVEDWNKIVMAFEAGAPELENDYPDWVKGTVYEEGSTAGACVQDQNLKQIFDIGVKTSDYNETNIIALTAAEANITGFKFDADFEKSSSGWASVLVTVKDENDNILTESRVRVGGKPSDHSVIMLSNISYNVWMEFDLALKGISEAQPSVLPRDVGAGDQTFKVEVSGMGTSNQVHLKIWVIYDVDEEYVCIISMPH